MVFFLHKFPGLTDGLSTDIPVDQEELDADENNGLSTYEKIKEAHVTGVAWSRASKGEIFLPAKQFNLKGLI